MRAHRRVRGFWWVAQAGVSMLALHGCTDGSDLGGGLERRDAASPRAFADGSAGDAREPPPEASQGESGDGNASDDSTSDAGLLAEEAAPLQNDLQDSATDAKPAPAKLWSTEEARAWVSARPWINGFNYVPSTAVNSTEMWQDFDPLTIDRELAYAEPIGLNSCRVFIQYLVWAADPAAMMAHVDAFLEMAHAHGISVMPVLFDDVSFSGKQPYLGRQDPPVAGVHNSGWTPSPGYQRRAPPFWPSLERYVRSFVARYGHDDRVIMWDLYNEPANGTDAATSQTLIDQAFGWARAEGPVQPLTAAPWDSANTQMTQFLASRSDVLTFHDYDNDYAKFESFEKEVQASGSSKPIVCTEWMHRLGQERPFFTHLKPMKDARVGSYFWGLTNGKTQTNYPWGSPPMAPEPAVWFHDLLHADGTPFDPAEVTLIKTLSGK